MPGQREEGGSAKVEVVVGGNSAEVVRNYDMGEQR